ncbi:hypothetical protein OQA88_3229 [Cercophora sp. LCS_1]
MLLALLASGLPLITGMATSAVHQRDSQNILVSLFFDKTTNVSSVIVSDKVKAKIFGHACVSTLTVGSLNIGYNVDQFGIGELRLGPKTYKVHSDASVSGGITCDTIYDDSELHIDCVAPWTSDIEPSELPADATQACFEDHLTRRAAYGLDGDVSEPLAPRDARETETRHHRRQAGSIGGSTCNPYKVTRLVGNGNPHQNYHNVQISENLDCKGATQCTVGYQQSKSFSVGWTSTVGVSWISGGFAVGQSWSTGNSYECTASKNERVCIKYKTAMTAYTVDGGWHNPCTGTTSWDTKNVIIWSPNKNNKGGGYYCVVGSSCKYQGNTWLVKEGRAGGP